jgi:hypothetical protein
LWSLALIYAHEQREKKTRYEGPRPGFPEQDEDLDSRMDAYLHSRYLSPDLARANGWYPSRYKGAPRIVIPCSNSAGVPYFQARDMSGKAKLRYASPAASRDDSIVLLFPEGDFKGSAVFEGPMDALAAAAHGYLGVAIMGNQPTREVFEYLVKHVRAAQPVMVVPDMDMLEFGPAVLCALGQAGISGMIRVPHKKDLGEMNPKERMRFLQ